MFSNLYCDNKIYRNLIGGDWVISDDSELIEIKSPIDGSIVGKVSAMNTAEVDKAIRVAKDSQKMWRVIPVSENQKFFIDSTTT